MDRNLKTMFENAIEIELLAAEIYRMYSYLFEHIPIVAELWSSMSNDEIRHAEVLKNAYESVPASELETQPGQLIWHNLMAVKKTLEKYRLVNIENLDKAIDIAHQMESSEINAIFEFLALRYVDSSARESFIEAEIMEHQKKLITFSEAYSGKCVRKNIKVKD